MPRKWYIPSDLDQRDDYFKVRRSRGPKRRSIYARLCALFSGLRQKLQQGVFCSTRFEDYKVLAELAETVPAFAVAKGGKLPAFGARIDQPPTRDGPPAPPSFTDSWFVPQGAARWR